MDTMTTTTTETNHDTTSAVLNAQLHFVTKVRTNLENFGRQWTSASLYAGKSALERSAENLRTAAGYLGDLAAKLNEDASATTAVATDAADDAEVVAPAAAEKPAAADSATKKK